MLARIAIAAVWLYQGLWCKLLGRDPRHKEIVCSVPFLRASVVAALGVLECGIALWALSGWMPGWSALTQTVLLAAMNLGGLIWARRMIPDGAGMLVQNFAFLVLVWGGVSQ